MKHEEYKDWLALEALGALATDESRSLAAHLSTCAECRPELDELRETAATLVYTIAPVAPPASLRARLLESVRTIHQQSSSTETFDDVDRNENETSDTPDTIHAAGSRTPFDEYGSWQLLASRPALRYGALAAALILCALVATSAVLWNRNRELRAEVARMESDAIRLQEELARGQQELVQARDIEEVVTTPDAPITVLAGTKEAPDARARLVYDRGTGRAFLATTNLPPAPAGKQYQLWYIAGGKPLPGGVFNTDASGRAVLRDFVPVEGRNASLFAITLEPAGGLSAPTGAKFLLGASS